jgi:hypothetical protein
MLLLVMIFRIATGSLTEVPQIFVACCCHSMNAPIMVDAGEETDPLEVGPAGTATQQHCPAASSQAQPQLDSMQAPRVDAENAATVALLQHVAAAVLCGVLGVVLCAVLHSELTARRSLGRVVCLQPAAAPHMQRTPRMVVGG